MTIDEAIAEVERRAAGRTRYHGDGGYLDELLAEEVKRLRASNAAKDTRIIKLKLKMDAIVAKATECADDLEIEITQRYGPDVHPALRLKYERDISTVKEMRALLTESEE
jgi:hypothetical protein